MNTSEWTFSEFKKLWEHQGVDLKHSVLAHSSAYQAFQTEAHEERVTVDESDAPQTLQEVRDWIGDCKRCGLCEKRTNIVFGDGNPKAKLLFIGEGPGADEDAQGLPFVGRSGKLLTKIIEAMGTDRKQVYIANVVKCRPPNNRAPLPDEVDACMGFVQAQVNIIKPTIVVALGMSATRLVVNDVTSMGAMRGKFHPLSWNQDIKVMPTFHPAYLLRNPPAKKEVWADMKKVIKTLGSKF